MTSVEPNTSNLSQNLSQVELKLTQHENIVRLSVLSPKGKSKTSNSICCVVDVSGSMDSSAAITTSQGINDMGYSILDIVKHALCTVVDNLDQNDHLQVIVFSNFAEVILDFSSMDETNKISAKEKINELSPIASTNMWAGIDLGLKQMQQKVSLNKPQHMLIFTDGLPNNNPSKGILASLKDVYGEYPLPKPVVYSVGFGYNLESNLLRQIAQLSSGPYYFIPDSSFVGTVFTNSLAVIQTTFATNAKIILKPLNKNAKIHPSQINSGLNVVPKYSNDFSYHLPIVSSFLGEIGYSIELGNLNYDSTKDILITEELNSKLLTDYSVELQYFKSDPESGKQVLHTLEAKEKHGKATELDIQREKFRLETVNILLKEKITLEKKSQAVDNLIKEIQESPFKDDIFIHSLFEDLNGQVKIALSKQEYFKRWGIHYLPSLAMAHAHKTCSNFKDPGIQPYGGDLFKTLRDSIEEQFLLKPPPKPSRTPRRDSQNSNWSAYMNSSNPCFDGMGIVEMGDGSVKRVKDIKKGDRVYCPNSRKLETVKCVIQTDIQSQCLPLVRLNNQNGSDNELLITPYHPVRIQGQWIFPHSLSLPQLQPCPTVYSFLLESGHSMSINGIECVTFAHGFSDNQVISHDYFGTDKIVKDLRWMKGWMAGHIKLTPESIIRDPQTTEVIGIQNNRLWVNQLQKTFQKRLIPKILSYGRNLAKII